jgi:molecular chaperone DnaK
MGKVIGIDLGTTNSVAAFFEGGSAHIVPTPEGERLLPSLVAFTSAGDRLVGNPAKSQLITNPNTIYSVKRLMGKRFSEVKPYLYQFNYQIVEGEDDTLRVRVNDVLFAPEEISAMIIERLKEAAENHLNDTIEGAIITVPAYFNDSQRQATKDAGEIAGLNVLRIINEPTAASLAFSLDLTRKSNVVVYDFGGGTIDISVLEIQDEVLKVLATAGDINLGGNDFDLMITHTVVAEIKQEYGIDLSDDKLAVQRIRDASENAKKELSSVEEFEINLPFIVDTDDGPVHYSRYFTRKKFETLIANKVNKTLEICERALKAAGLNKEEVNEVILVGGSTRIPMVQQKTREFFKREPNKKVNPDEIVAMGAAMQGAIVKGESKDILLLDVTPLSLGVKTYGGAFTRIIENNTTIPTNRSLVFSTVEDYQQEVEIMVYQGEREIAEENKLLGKFTLTEIKPAPKGGPRIEVTFSININGILTVSAIDLSTKSKKEVLVTNSGLLSDKEITEIKRNAEKYKESDLKKKQLIDLKNRVVSYIYSIKKILDTPGADPQLAADAQGLVKGAHSAMEREIEDELEKILEELAAMEKGLMTYVTASAPEADMEIPPVKPAPPSFTNKKAEKLAKEKKNLESLEEKIRGTDLITLEANKIKKEILNYAFAIEQYIQNVQLEGKILSESRDLVKKAHSEIEKDKPQNLGKLHKDLAEMAVRLDELVGQTLGVTNDTNPTPTISEAGIEAAFEAQPPPPQKDKDDTKPFRIVKH